MSFLALHTLEKIRDDVNKWFLAQKCERIDNNCEVNSYQANMLKWPPPPRFWLKCNIGSVWNKRKQKCGDVWVLRNSEGRVMLHGRKSFPNISSSFDANVACLLWAIESIDIFKVSKVVFVLEAKEPIGAITRPPAWPSIRYQYY